MECRTNFKLTHNFIGSCRPILWGWYSFCFLVEIMFSSASLVEMCQDKYISTFSHVCIYHHYNYYYYTIGIKNIKKKKESRVGDKRCAFLSRVLGVLVSSPDPDSLSHCLEIVRGFPKSLQTYRGSNVYCAETQFPFTSLAIQFHYTRHVTGAARKLPYKMRPTNF
jgi:hypothetical protein